MTFVPSSQSSALLILLQTSRVPSSQASRERSDTALVAAANGVALPDASHAGGATSVAKAKISDALFKVNSPSVTELKLHLMKRLGDELGIALDDHASHASFGAALRSAIAEMKLKPNGASILSAIEKKLGFDKLGFSLDTFVNAIIDPKGRDAAMVEAALKKHLGLDEKRDGRTADAPLGARGPFLIDGSGLYGFKSA